MRYTKAPTRYTWNSIELNFESIRIASVIWRCSSRMTCWVLYTAMMGSSFCGRGSSVTMMFGRKNQVAWIFRGSAPLKWQSPSLKPLNTRPFWMLSGDLLEIYLWRSVDTVFQEFFYQKTSNFQNWQAHFCFNLVKTQINCTLRIVFFVSGHTEFCLRNQRFSKILMQREKNLSDLAAVLLTSHMFCWCDS